MERLTERKTPCWIKTKSGKDYTNYTQDWDAIDKLTHYEDTGLTPPEIMKLKERDTAKAPTPSKTGLICQICGERAAFVDRFCGNCGQRFEED